MLFEKIKKIEDLITSFSFATRYDHLKLLLNEASIILNKDTANLRESEVVDLLYEELNTLLKSVPTAQDVLNLMSSLNIDIKF